MASDAPIATTLAVFSPGRGGRALAVRLLREYPSQPLAVFSDLHFAPYGKRPREEVVEYAARGIAWLAQRGAKTVVLACNTTSLVREHLGTRFADQQVELVDVLSATERGLRRLDSRLALGVVGTPATIDAGHYQRVLKSVGVRSARFNSSSTLARLIDESGGLLTDAIDGEIAKLLGGLADDGWHPTHILLGCTHYELVESCFRDRALEMWGRPVTCIGQSGSLIDELRRCGHLPNPAPESRSALRPERALGVNVHDEPEMREFAATWGMSFHMVDPA